jgi:DNA-binding PadR family transcriptional regulator
MFVFVVRGFTNKDLRQQFAVLLGKRADEISPGRMSYELRRLRLHGLIERLPKTHRYRLTDEGLRTALFYTRVYARILRPAMAPAVPAASPQALRQFYAAEDAVNSWCDQAHIAA